VEVTHWQGALDPGPHFDLYPAGKPETGDGIVTKSDSSTTLSSGAISATAKTTDRDFDIRFHATDGSKELTSLLNRSVGFAYSPGPNNQLQTGDMRNIQHYIFTQTTLSVGESVHGLGERFGAFNKVGQSITLWNADGGTSSEQAYKNVSFWISSRGYGIFIDTPDKIELEVGSERSCRVQTSVEGQRLKWYKCIFLLFRKYLRQSTKKLQVHHIWTHAKRSTTEVFDPDRKTWKSSKLEFWSLVKHKLYHEL
jgi:alpha-D-xyloside xylohydrolase